MAEVGSEVQVAAAPAPDVDVDPIVEQAKEMGWRPKEEYEGDPSKWVDANIFVARAPLFEKIESQSKTLKEAQKAIKELKEFQSKIAENEYKRALETLKAERRNALAEGDLVAADEVNDKIDALRSKPPVQAAPTVPPEFLAWKERNSWYDTDEDMRDFADARGNKLGAQGNLGPDEVLQKVEEAVRKAFPEKFKSRNPNRERAAAVETESAVGIETSTSKGFRLTDDEEKVMRTFVKTGVMSKEDYIKEIKRLRG